MSDEAFASFPPATRVLMMLRERVPAHGWDARRVILCVRDFEHIIDVELVAARCADWLLGPDAQRVRDAPAQLRRYFEQEKAKCAPNVTSLRGRLAVYAQPHVIPASPGGESAQSESRDSPRLS